VLAPPTTGVPFLIYSGAFAGVMWAVVAVVATANGWQRWRRSIRTEAA